MADKEAFVYIVDMGKSMGQRNGGRDESDFDFSMRYIWDKLSTTASASRKTWAVGIIGLRTDESDNPMTEMGLEGYENISILQPLGPITLTDMRTLREKLHVSRNLVGDAISAVVLAIEMINVFTKKLTYTKRIYMLTDGLGPIDADALDEMAEMMNDSKIELIILGVDFDDPEYGFKEEDKPTHKQQNEAIMRQLVCKCNNGDMGTIAQAVAELENPRIKKTKPFKTYDGFLTLGDPEEPLSTICIHVERYFRTKRATAPSASTIVFEKREETVPRSKAFDKYFDLERVDHGVKTMRNYKVNDPSAPGGKRDVAPEKLAKGYNYGRTMVPISEAEWNITQLETTKSFSILGFIPRESYDPFMSMGETCTIIAKSNDEESALALSSFVNALYELESYAVARYVQKDGAQPKLLLLMPNPKLDDDYECLYDVPLPFAEDVRSYSFPPLDKVITVTGNVLTKHRLLPTDELNEAMSDYVDAMDLSTAGKDVEGNPAEYAKIEDAFNPTIHRLDQAIRARAINPDEAIGSIPPVLIRFAAPPEHVVKKATPQIDALIETAAVKKVPLKAESKRRKEQIKPISDLDVQALLGETPFSRIDPKNPIPSFKDMLRQAQDENTIREATKQMANITRRLITDSLAFTLYDQAEANLQVMRSWLIEYERPDLYNQFVTSLKDSLLSGALGGERRDMWRDHIVRKSLGLIASHESEVSEVTTEEAEKFLR